MTTELAENKTFQEKLTEKIKEGIGDLISSDELRPLIERGIEETFFKPSYKKEGNGYYNDRVIEIPSLMHGLIKEALLPEFREVVKEYFSKHPEKIEKILESVLKDNAADMLRPTLNEMIGSHFISFKYKIIEELSRKTGGGY